MSFRVLLIAVLALFITAPAFASEQINRFETLIEVQQDGDITVTETIDVTVAGWEIKRGIFRDLPRYYEHDGLRLPFSYPVLEVTRNGAREPYDTNTDENAYRIRIGDPDVMIEHGRSVYVIRYEVRNQVRYFDGYDEVYWNATGNYWNFAILEAEATVVLPPGAEITETRGYTGAVGHSGAAYTYRRAGDRHIFHTSDPLQPREGLTVAVGFQSGLIDQPSGFDRALEWWQRYGALAILLISLGGLLWFLYRGFDKVGRDPTKGPVFPRYEPPTGYSPGAVHHIFYRAVTGHSALIATLLNLAIKRRIEIDARDKKETVLTRRSEAGTAAGLAPEDLALESSIFQSGGVKHLGQTYDAGFTSAYTTFNTALGNKYGSSYFRWNMGYTLVAIAITVIVVAIAATQVTQWTLWHTLAVIGLAAINAAFLYLMPAPTQKGQQVRTEIEGFRLYMEKAEKLQLNAFDVGLEQPPPMTVQRYERFLPYAVALGVEEPWTKHFERLIPEQAASYRPYWTNMSSAQSFGALTSSMVSNMSSGVTSALPQSSSSSGSGGGGSSGGGGGGGGGGGW